MISLRKLPAAARAAAYWAGLAGQGARQERAGRILMLHGTPKHHAGELERQLAWLARAFRVVPLGELVERLLAGGRRLPATVALTFDDGLRNNVEVAYPILRRLGLPATFFVCPGLIERREWLWPHANRQRLRHAGAERLRRLARELDAPGELEAFMDWMKSLDIAARRRAEQAVRAATADYRPSPAEHHEFDLATWDELRTLDPRLVSVGSHTLNHPILPSLSEAEAEEELAGSQRAIEEKLDRPVELFAYPNGDASPAVQRLVQKLYRAAVDTAHGWARAGADLHRLPRINVPPGVLRLAAALHAEPRPLRRPDQRSVAAARSGASQPL